MRPKKIMINWQDILWDGMMWLYTKKTERRKIDVDDEDTDKVGAHGRYVSPTYARIRKITLEGYIDNIWNAREQEAFEYLQNMFSLQGDVSSIKPLTLYVKDHHDNEWTMQVKVAEPREVFEADEVIRDYARERAVELESVEDPRYYSLEEMMQNILEGDFGGMTLDCALPVSFDQYSNVVTLTNSWNTSTSMRREIDVISDFDAPITVRNINTGAQMQFDVWWVVWDKIVIDTWNYTATKNWQNILSSRVAWSSRLQLQGTQSFVVFTLDGWLDHSDLDVNIYFRNALL